jgi:uncharacterized protein
MAKKILIKIIDFYKKYISNFLPFACRYYPTCSVYTRQSIEKYGALRGCLKGGLRILRCNPLFAGGVDEP